MKCETTNAKNILFGSSQYILKYYYYEWEREHYEVVWQDIIKNVRDNCKHPHFFGVIVTCDMDLHGDKRIIIDGHQRMITLFVLFLAMIRAGKIEYEEEKVKQRLIFEKENDRDAFDTLFSRNGMFENDAAIIHAYRFFYDELKTFDETHLGKDIFLRVLEKFEIVEVYIKYQEYDPDALFENIQKKGKNFEEYCYQDTGGAGEERRDVAGTEALIPGEEIKQRLKSEIIEEIRRELDQWKKEIMEKLEETREKGGMDTSGENNTLKSMKDITKKSLSEMKNEIEKGASFDYTKIIQYRLFGRDQPLLKREWSYFLCHILQELYSDERYRGKILQLPENVFFQGVFFSSEEEVKTCGLQHVELKEITHNLFINACSNTNRKVNILINLFEYLGIDGKNLVLYYFIRNKKKKRRIYR